jgi:hypothetical protein
MVSSREKFAIARPRIYRAKFKNKGIAPDMNYAAAAKPMESRAGI